MTMAEQGIKGRGGQPSERVTPKVRRWILSGLQRGETPEKIATRIGVTSYVVRTIVGDLAAEELQRPHEPGGVDVMEEVQP